MSIAEDFKAGDVVELRSGSEPMTIYSIDEDELTADLTLYVYTTDDIKSIEGVPLIALKRA